MSTEPRRGCGFRKVGGLYLVSGGAGVPCGRLPIILSTCPTCGGGIKQTRSWQWVAPGALLEHAPPCEFAHVELSPEDRLARVFGHHVGCDACPLSHPRRLGERAGLIWIGEKFYPTPHAFSEEAAKLGISRRVNAIPRGFKVGVTWVLLAHPRVLVLDDGAWLKGIFRVFRPERIEKIVTASQAADAAAVAELRERGITPVVVPDGDSDHQGSVYDDDAELELPLEATQ